MALFNNQSVVGSILPENQKESVFCCKHQTEQFHNRKDEVHVPGGLQS